MKRPLRVLFLCTRNSARSQLAEALLQQRRDHRLEAHSAGTEPAERVHPAAVAELHRRGIAWSDAQPKTIDSFGSRRWDIVITVCDQAHEACPVLPGRPAVVHWGLPDPADVAGDEDAVARAFQETARVLARRIDLLLALPLDKLELLALEQQLRAIGDNAASLP